MTKPDLLVAACDYKAAKYAVMNWHYSKSMPVGKLLKFGAWEDGQFIGAVIFGRGSNNNIGKPYNLDQTEVCELVRVALSEHLSPTSQIVSSCIRWIKSNQKIRLIVSYADSRQDHVGTIYQAMNWIYTGSFKMTDECLLNGRWVHARTFNAAKPNQFSNAKKRDGGGKTQIYIPTR